MRGITGILAAEQLPVFQYANRNPKFAEEKLCAEDDRYLIHFDGILLNHAKPVRENERFDLLSGLYEQNGAQLTAHLKGQFDLVLWDKQHQKVLITNDLLSKRTLYYCVRESKLFYAASYADLLELLSAEKQPLTVNAKAVERMALAGALGGAETYLQGVCYLEAYQALIFDLKTGKTEVISVQPKAAPAASSVAEAADTFDRLFTAAVRAQFGKNGEYGYDQRISLSGGMDSRACLLKAVACGYNSAITCVTYSQAGSVDYTVSQQIAFDHHLDYLFYPMDAAVFMDRLDDALACNECQQSSIGSTGARTMAKMLDQTRSGIMHVGLCGGELMGDLIAVQGGGRLKGILRRLGLAGTEGLTFILNRQDYLDNLRACQNFSKMFLSDCEAVSPFMDEDVVQFVSGLKPELLYRRSLYREWMKKFIPNSYPTTYFCGPVDISPVKEVLAKAADALVRKLAGASKRDMNPIERWVQNNPKLAEKLETEYQTGMEQLKKTGMDGEPLSILQKAWTASAERRLYVLTAMTALKEIAERR